MRFSQLIQMVCCLLIFNSFLLQAQSRINIQIHTHPPTCFAELDSANLFENKYVNQDFIKNLQQKKSKRISIRDSLQVEQAILQVRQNIRAYGRLRNKTENNNAEKVAILREAYSSLQQSLELKPNDKKSLRYLKMISPAYKSLLRKENDFEGFVDIATSQLVITEPQNQFSIFYTLGDAYYRLEDYELSRSAYNQTVVRLFEFYEDSLSADNQKYIDYLYRSLVRRGTCEEKLYLSSAALRSWKHALIVAPEAEKESIKLKIDQTLLWDDGHLEAYEKRSEALKLYRDKQYWEAKQQLVQLLPTLYTYTAKAEINRLIAQIDFTSLDNHAAGLERMQKIVTEYPEYVFVSDSLVDSTYLSYQQIYAQLCYLQGIHEMRRERTREAFIYFAKAAEITSKSQAQATFYLALLLSSDRNSVMHAEKIISYGLKAWAGELPESYRKRLADILSFAYQQQGSFDEAITWKNRSLAIN